MKGIFPFLAFVVVQPLLLSNNNKKRNAVLKTNLDSLCIQLDKCAAVHFVGLNVLVYPHSRILNFQKPKLFGSSCCCLRSTRNWRRQNFLTDRMN